MQSLLIDVRVLAVRELTDRIREYLLTSVNGAALPRYEPGAHIELHVASPTLGAFVRHYSLIGGAGMVSDEPHIYRIAVQREDRRRGSAYIHENFAPGTTLRISRPKNHFILGRNEARSLLIAGGIGITPIYSMLRSLVRRKKDFTLVYSGRTAEALAYRSEVTELAGEHGAVHLSGDPATNHLDLKALLASQSDDTTVYVCGPAPMVDATYAAGAELGWAQSRIRSELFGVASSADDADFDVFLARSMRTVRVARDATILDALTCAGVDVLSDCRRGECGLCPLNVVSVDGAIDHRDRYLTDEERAAGKTLCICVSRVRGNNLTLDA